MENPNPETTGKIGEEEQTATATEQTVVPEAATENTEAVTNEAAASPENGVANEAVDAQAAPETKTCSRCGTEIAAELRFCPKCGNNCVVAPVINENIAAFNAQLEEEKAKKKQKTRRTFLIVVAAIVAFFVLIFGGKAIYRAATISSLESTVEKYNDGKIDFAEASEKIENKKDSSDEKIVAQAVQSSKDLEELKVSKDNFAKAEEAYGKKDYANAVANYSAVIEKDSNYETAQNKIKEIIPLWKKVLPSDVDKLLKEGKTEEAKKAISGFLEYSDDKDIKNIQTFIEAEENYAKGHLNKAQSIYKTLPTTLKVNGITVKSRLATLKKYSVFVKMCGEWECTSYYKETKEKWRSGRSTWWYNDGDGKGNSDTLVITCVINKNGTVTVKGQVEYWMYTNYSSYQSLLKNKTFTASFKVTVKLSQGKNLKFSYSEGDFVMGSTPLKDTQTITFNGSKFTHSSTVTYHYSYYCDEIYSSKDTFGKRTEKY